MEVKIIVDNGLKYPTASEWQVEFRVSYQNSNDVK